MFKVFIILGATFTTLGNEIKQRVIAGEDANIEEYPFLVMVVGEMVILNGSIIRTKGCSGSLIDEQWVLTAAHCGGTWIRYPNTSVPFDEESMFIKVIESFPCQNADVQLLKLEKPASVKWYAKISSVDYKTFTGRRADIIGFGLTYLSLNSRINIKYVIERVVANRSMPLQRGGVIIIPCTKFKLTRTDTYVRIGSHICIGPPCYNRGLQPYFADSGSPLLVDGTIVGVCSYGYLHTIAYAATSPHLNWIQSIINKT